MFLALPWQPRTDVEFIAINDLGPAEFTAVIHRRLLLDDATLCSEHALREAVGGVDSRPEEVVVDRT
jgi:hypothetical protein